MNNNYTKTFAKKGSTLIRKSNPGISGQEVIMAMIEGMINCYFFHFTLLLNLNIHDNERKLLNSFAGTIILD